MVDFEFLEQTALRIKENRSQLLTTEDLLAKIKFQIHEIPLKRSTESTFAKMIGVGYDDKISVLENEKTSLESKRDELRTAVKNDMDVFISEFSSQNLVIPLDSTPTIVDKKIVYKYRNNSTFPHIFDILSEILGLSSPLVVKDVLLSQAEIVIATPDEFEAKQKFVSSMSEIQNTLLIKKKK